MSEVNKRITIKRTNPNPLFQSWLEKYHKEAIAKRSKLEPMLKDALESLSKYPLPLESGAECAILSGFNKNLCLFLDKCLETYKTNNSLKKKKRKLTLDNEQPSTSQIINNNSYIENNPQCSSSSQTVTSNNLNVGEKIQHTEILQQPIPDIVTRKKEYRPAYRSGGYAILLGLLEILKLNNNQTTNKHDLILTAQKYSEESFIRPKPESYYTAWSNMGKLITKGYVNKSGGKKALFSLTERGRNLAEELFEESKNISTSNDIIFNSNAGSCSYKSSENMKDIELGEPSSNSNLNIDSIPKTVPQNNDTVVIEMQAGSYDIILLIDKNETSGCNKTDPMVAQFGKYPDLNHEYRSLKVGDYTWIARHKINKDQEFVLPYVVERKRMDDLGSSIKDGRFHEQKFRLRKCGVKNLIYMVENYGSNKYVGLPVQTLMQALANTRVQDDFKVHVTNSLTCSARFLAILTKRLTIEYKDRTLKGHNHEPSADILMTFNFFNKSSLKTKPLTVTDNFIKLLLQMKGVSVEKALAITNMYKTPSSLMKAYASVDRKVGEVLLANLKYNDSRNVGPTISKSIYQLFSLVN